MNIENSLKVDIKTIKCYIILIIRTVTWFRWIPGPCSDDDICYGRSTSQPEHDNVVVYVREKQNNYGQTVYKKQSIGQIVYKVASIWTNLNIMTSVKNFLLYKLIFPYFSLSFLYFQFLPFPLKCPFNIFVNLTVPNLSYALNIFLFFVQYQRPSTKLLSIGRQITGRFC